MKSQRRKSFTMNSFPRILALVTRIGLSLFALLILVFVEELIVTYWAHLPTSPWLMYQASRGILGGLLVGFPIVIGWGFEQFS